MKAKSNLPKRAKPKKAQQAQPDTPKQLFADVKFPKKQRKPKLSLPDHPVAMVDLNNLPQITEHEITEYLNALYNHRLALADYERRRADLSYKLALQCRVDPKSEIKVRLDEDGRIVLTEERSTCLSKFDPRVEMTW